MPIIREGNRLYFQFDTNKPRSEDGRGEALRRWESVRERDKQVHSIHHIDADRSNGNADNLFVCESQKQHTKLHLQLQEITSQLIKAGLIKFCFKAKRYFIDNFYIASQLKDNNRDDFISHRPSGSKVNSSHREEAAQALATV